ncbi:MAG: hypothetical protein NWF06_10155 [Candidatus Bathyarchaeota archaeon]|nr:hypothetical protein [Candidatus Bathyarchaeum sp.]
MDDKIYAIGGQQGTAQTPTKYCNTNEVYTPTGYIPELSSWLALPLVITGVLVAVLVKKKLQKTACTRD